ncbi:hypothetical protein CFBP5875_19090 [Agrobacterium pusense]|uniref:hypothetical protein n=1 Tax=Agrobacterium pusense TaxID=648995 RepID=UPI0010BF56E0|nr:hypothetical protein [Agrobacterium pusense]QCL86707.1 hypothetical protein CFBP5875_19090 [Agrobacterium pusense]
MIEALHVSHDAVIKSAFISAATTFDYAIEHFFPLLDRFGEQRKAQSKKFYERLRNDIVSGCVMPPITLAFINPTLSTENNPATLRQFITNNIAEGYILDGMQRMITLKDASEIEGYEGSRTLYVNIIVAERYDLLLYRMITLNNGQKPMTARHQIEMLTKGAIDLSGTSLEIVSEKQTEGTKIRNAFRMSDIAEAYTAYLSDSLHNQNTKIIESKLDEILVGRVMESDITNQQHSFSDILREIGRLQVIDENKDWLRQVNNIIGFTVGAKKSLNDISAITPDEFLEKITNFEKAFDAINTSKVNVGKYRRELSRLFISEIAELGLFDRSQLEELFFDETMTD